MDPQIDELAERVGRIASEGAAIAVGLGVMTLNRAQAIRRDLERRLRTEDDGPTDAAG